MYHLAWDGEGKFQLGSDAVSGGALALRSLAPEFDEDQHRLYVELLVDAIENKPSVRNIALTGPYGTGKSSILGKVAEEYPDRVVEISFSTVGKKPGKGAVAATEADPETRANPAAGTPTNQIEKEIVKQILYREDPSRMRGSRFRRITRFRWGQQAVFGLVVGLLAVGVLFLTGLDKPFMAAAGSNGALLWLSHGLLLLLISCSVVVVRWLTHNRVFLEKFTAGPATVSLSPQSSSYFDEYLDEIVYYFEASRRDIVVFEDIDRFDDVHIFEALRALNTLLNGAQQVRRRRPKRKNEAKDGSDGRTARRPVKFIYALRDSVFERLGGTAEPRDQVEDEARTEVERANRTKFFELVVPVVPFITHRNARDLMTDAMKGTEVSAELVDVAARHMADMRLIRNVRNEYDVFAKKLLGAPDGKRLSGLDADRLFAMVLYKNVHMSDFEKIRFGDSRLDKLHREWRKLVRENIAHETSTAREAASRLDALDAIAARSEHLGARLEKVVQVVARRGSQGPAQADISIDNTAMDSTRLRDGATWTRLIKGRGDIRINLRPAYLAYTIPFEELPDLLGVDIVPEEWDSAQRADLVHVRDEAQERIHFLRHHTWQELAAHPGFTLPVSGGLSFSRLVQNHLGSELARELVSNGFINDYFALYVSVYYGEHLRLDALNYVVQHIDRGEADPVYPLTGEDVDAIIAEKGEGILLDPSMYNHSALDHLLEKNPHLAKTLLGQLAVWGASEQAFASDYLVYGNQRQELVEGLAPLVPEVFEWLAAHENADESLRALLIDAALRRWDPELGYSLGPAVRSYFEDHAGELASLADDGRAEDAAKAMFLIAASGAALPSLRPLSAEAVRAAADLGCYRVTSENLRLLTGAMDNALDTIREAAEKVYRHVLDELAQYLTAIQLSNDGAATVQRPGSFAQVIHDMVAAQAEEHILAAVIRGAAADCTVPDLLSVPAAAWDALAAGHRTLATFANVSAAVAHAGGVSTGLAALLSQDTTLSEMDGVSDDARVDLAVRLLSSRDALPDPELRVSLAGSLVDPDLQISVTSIQPESGKLIGMLLERGIIADDPAAFSPSLVQDWDTREAAIEGSEHFIEYISPAILPPEDLPEFFSSARIRHEVKQAVLDDLASYATDASAVRAAVAYADQEGISLDYARLQLAVHSETDDQLLVRLMAASPLAEHEMRDLLHRMGGDYALIAEPGMKRPLIPDDPAHRVILDRLAACGVVSRYQPEREGTLRVFLRR